MQSLSIHKIFIFILAFSVCGKLVAQYKSQGAYVGLDISKNLQVLFDNYSFQQSFIVEPSLAIPVGTLDHYINIATGYSYINANPIFKNFNYYNRGVFLKAGIDYFPYKFLGIGATAVVSVYDESGRFTLAGPYFGDLIVDLEKRRLTMGGLEGRITLRQKIFSRIWLHPVIRFCIHSNANKWDPDSYYIPGIGVTSRGMPFTGGFSVQLVYEFGK